MARPIKKGLDYFSHDVDMSEDLKIKKLEAKFGLTGYAVYNKILEQQYKYAGEFNLITEENILLYCKEWKITQPKLEKIIRACIDLKLFENENLLSSSIEKRLEKINNYRKTKRERFTVSKNEDNKNKDLQVVSEEQNIGETPQSKVKESKEKKRRGDEAPPPDFLKISFADFEKGFLCEKDAGLFGKYDLQIYFEQVMEKYPKEKSIAEIIKRVKKFISCDESSNGKFIPHLKRTAHKDSVTVAYEHVQKNLEWIKSLPDKNPDEVIPVLAAKCREPARNDTLFEAYIEKALRHYKCLQ